MAEQVRQCREQYHSCKCDPDSRDFGIADVFVDEAFVTTFNEEHLFESKVNFRQHRGMTPEEAGLSQIVVKNHKGDDVWGVLKYMEEGAKADDSAVVSVGAVPSIKVSSVRSVKKRTYLLRSDENFYQTQADEIIDSHTKKVGRYLQFRCGDRYDAVNKSFS